MRPKAEDSLVFIDTGRPVGPATAPVVPEKLGRYKIVHKLGQGAMGIVYRALDPMINREVALKVIPLATEFDADELEEARAKFFREAEMAGPTGRPVSIKTSESSAFGRMVMPRSISS